MSACGPSHFRFIQQGFNHAFILRLVMPYGHPHFALRDTDMTLRALS